MKEEKNLRILVAPLEIGGYFSNLAKGLRSLGYRCEHYNFRTVSDELVISTLPKPLRPAALWNLRVRNTFIRINVKNRPLRLLFQIPSEILIFLWTLVAIFRYDVFIFGFGASLWPMNADMPLLKILGKTVISNMALGSDSRPPFMNGAVRDDLGTDLPGRKYIRMGNRLRRRLRRHERLSSFVIGSPFSTSQFATAPFVNSFLIGSPVSPPGAQTGDNQNPQAKPKMTDSSQGPVKILHAPTRRLTKGTDEILQAVQLLRESGHQIELQILEKVPNQQVFQTLETCDFIVDQVYSDIPFSVFASEAALIGKPSVVGGYDFDNMEKICGGAMWPPAIRSKPENIAEAIEELVLDKKLRMEIGEKAQKFATTQITPQAVAAKYVELFSGRLDESYFYDPADNTYFHGIGQPESITLSNVYKVIEVGGRQALGLSNSSMADALCSLAANQSEVNPAVPPPSVP